MERERGERGREIDGIMYQADKEIERWIGGERGER